MSDGEFATVEDMAGGGNDYVGIMMAKSEEGGAVARVMARVEGVEIIEQPAFWEIKAPHRMAISYDEVGEELGVDDIDGYALQREMSTYYGRMVATDDDLLLFADPAEAMEHLM